MPRKIPDFKVSTLHFYNVVLIVLILLPQVKAQTADEIISKNLEARGGIAKIKGIETQRLEGEISFGQDSAKPFIVEMKRTGKMRDEIMINGVKIINTTDGKSGWVLNPLSGSDSVRPMNSDELKNASGSAEIGGPLVDYKLKGNKVTYAGKEKINGKETYKLIITMKDDDIRNDFIDCKTFLEIKWVGYILSNGKKTKVETYFKNYKRVNGLMYSFLLESDTPGTPYKQKIVLKKIDINIPLKDSLFEKPTGNN